MSELFLNSIRGNGINQYRESHSVVMRNYAVDYTAGWQGEQSESNHNPFQDKVRKEEDVLLSEQIKKFYPELVTPNLTRHKSKSHWRNQRNKTRREKAASLLAKLKAKTICRQLTSRKDEFPLLSLCDDGLDIWVGQEYDVIDIEVSDTDLIAYDIEMTGHCCEEHLIELLDTLIDRVANQF